MAGAAGTGARYEVEAGARFSWHAAHIDDAVNVVATEGAPVVRCVQVADIDVVCHLGDDGFRVLEVFGATGFGLRCVGAPGTSRPRSGSPAVVTQLLGARARRRVGVRLRAAVPGWREERKAAGGFALVEDLHRAGQAGAGRCGGSRGAEQRRPLQ